jgi:hypothetical protein
MDARKCESEEGFRLDEGPSSGTTGRYLRLSTAAGLPATG